MTYRSINVDLVVVGSGATEGLHQQGISATERAQRALANMREPLAAL